MRITFLDDEPEIYPIQYGGKARTIIAFAQELAKDPSVEKVSVISRSINGGKKEFYERGVRFKKLEGYRILRQILDEVSSCDVLNVHACSFTMPLLTGFETVLVNHLHDVIYATVDAGSHLDKALGNNWSRIISPSPFATRTLRNVAWWSDLPSRAITLERPVDRSAFRRIEKGAALRKLYNLHDPLAREIEESYPVLFFPHRFGACKGEEFLVPLYDLLKGTHPRPLILSTSAQGQGYAPIKNIGWIQTQELPFFYAVADATLVLSKAPESFCNVVLESISCGTPVVSFLFGNLSDLSKKLPAIRTATPRPESICEGIEAILTDKGAVSKDVSYSRELVGQEHSLKRIAKQLLGIYHHAPQNIHTALPRQETAVSAKHVRYFKSPCLAEYGTEVFISSPDGAVSRVTLNDLERRITDACASAASLEHICRDLRTHERDVAKATIHKLVSRGVLVEG